MAGATWPDLRLNDPVRQALLCQRGNSRVAAIVEAHLTSDPAALRIPRQAVRQDVIGLVSSNRLLRPCHGNTKCSGSRESQVLPREVWSSAST